MSITRINTNTDALVAGMYLNRTGVQMSRTLSHLSTGLRIVTAADDPSGIALASIFRAQVSGVNMAIQNTEDGLSLMNTADSAMSQQMDILLRMRDLAVRASTEATLTDTQRRTMESEVQRLRLEIGKRTTAVTFNGKSIFSGGLSRTTIFIGPDNTAAFKLSIQIPNLSNTNIGGYSLTGIMVSNVADAQSAIGLASAAINGLANIQTLIGTQEKMLERMLNKLQTEEVNVAAATSRIQDADMASEISTFAKQQIIAQAATAMIAQANTLPQSVMKLLGIG